MPSSASRFSLCPKNYNFLHRFSTQINMSQVPTASHAHPWYTRFSQNNCRTFQRTRKQKNPVHFVAKVLLLLRFPGIICIQCVSLNDIDFQNLKDHISSRGAQMIHTCSRGGPSWVVEMRERKMFALPGQTKLVPFQILCMDCKLIASLFSFQWSHCWTVRANHCKIRTKSFYGDNLYYQGAIFRALEVLLSPPETQIYSSSKAVSLLWSGAKSSEQEKHSKS